MFLCSAERRHERSYRGVCDGRDEQRGGGGPPPGCGGDPQGPPRGKQPFCGRRSNDAEHCYQTLKEIGGNILLTATQRSIIAYSRCCKLYHTRYLWLEKVWNFDGFERARLCKFRYHILLRYIVFRAFCFTLYLLYSGSDVSAKRCLKTNCTFNVLNVRTF